MSKFKVGDRVRFTEWSPIWEGAPEVIVVKNIHHGGRISLENNPQNGHSDYDETKLWVYNEDWFDLVDDTDTRTITLSGTTYTLTPYEAPKLVTIDDVVYVMTEAV